MHEHNIPYGFGVDSPFIVGKLYNWRPSSSHFYNADGNQEFSFHPKMNPVMCLEIKQLHSDVLDVRILTAQAEIAWVRVNDLFYDDWKIINS